MHIEFPAGRNWIYSVIEGFAAVSAHKASVSSKDSAIDQVAT